MIDAYVQAAILGVVEAATEFLPISSTGHLLLADKVMGFGSQNNVFEVAIQLGAILAIVVLYFGRLWKVLVGLPNDPKARAFAAFVILAFLPSAALGVMLHDYVKNVLFNPTIVCVALVAGGFAILAVEHFAPKAKVKTVEGMGWKRALAVGVGQCLSLIPGVSRSGATIMTAVGAGIDRKVATEFSFFLSIPTMFGAVGYDLFKNRHDLASNDMVLIGIGFVVAFVMAMPVVKWLVGFVSKHGFAPFAYYRIALGLLGLVLLAS